MDTLQPRGIYQPNPAPEAVEDVFISELHGLINQRHFDQFDGNTIEDIDFSDALGIVQEKTITSIVCHSQAVKKSNFLTSALALYLVGSGTKRRVESDGWLRHYQGLGSVTVITRPIV